MTTPAPELRRTTKHGEPSPGQRWLVPPLDHQTLNALMRLAKRGADAVLQEPGGVLSRTQRLALASVAIARRIMVTGRVGRPLLRMVNERIGVGFVMRGNDVTGDLYLQLVTQAGDHWLPQPSRTWTIEADQVEPLANALLAWQQDRRHPAQRTARTP